MDRNCRERGCGITGSQLGRTATSAHLGQSPRQRVSSCGKRARFRTPGDGVICPVGLVAHWCVPTSVLLGAGYPPASSWPRQPSAQTPSPHWARSHARSIQHPVCVHSGGMANLPGLFGNAYDRQLRRMRRPDDRLRFRGHARRIGEDGVGIFRSCGLVSVPSRARSVGLPTSTAGPGVVNLTHTLG